MNRKDFSGRFEPTRQHLTQLCPAILKSHASSVTNVNWAVFMAPWHIKPTSVCFLSSEDQSRLILANELVHVPNLVQMGCLKISLEKVKIVH